MWLYRSCWCGAFDLLSWTLRTAEVDGGKIVGGELARYNVCSLRYRGCFIFDYRELELFVPRSFRTGHGNISDIAIDNIFCWNYIVYVRTYYRDIRARFSNPLITCLPQRRAQLVETWLRNFIFSWTWRFESDIRRGSYHLNIAPLCEEDVKIMYVTTALWFVSTCRQFLIPQYCGPGEMYLSDDHWTEVYGICISLSSTSAVIFLTIVQAIREQSSEDRSQ